jgi:thioredoxin reductase
MAGTSDAPPPPRNTPVTHEVCIIGGGPAGLSAALLLGRCRRRVLVFDSGKPRNAFSRALHGYLTRDGTHPIELRALGRQQLDAYPNVTIRDTAVRTIYRKEKQFEVVTVEEERVAARIVLLATGRIDNLPPKPGFSTFYGHGVYHCPYCDGWEHREKTIVVHGHGENAFDQALLMLVWSPRVIICTDGPPHFTAPQREKLHANSIQIVEAEILELRGGEEGMLQSVIFRDRDPLACDALFFCSDCLQKSSLPENLGCEFDDEGSVKCHGPAAIHVPGLYVAGNVRGGIHLAIAAAAEGAEAAIAINRALLEADLH